MTKRAHESDLSLPNPKRLHLDGAVAAQATPAAEGAATEDAAPPAPENVLSAAEALATLEKWFTEVGISYNREAIELVTGYRGTGYGAAVISKRPITIGETVCTIPKDACLTPVTTAFAAALKSQQIPNILATTVALMYEQYLGEKSKWFGYLKSLPAFEPVYGLWTSEERDLAKGTELFQEFPNERRDNRDEFIEVVRPLMKKNAQKFGYDHKWFSWERFCHAQSLVSSRAFFVDNLHGSGMVPFADIFNHLSEELEHVHIEGLNPPCPDCGSTKSCAHLDRHLIDGGEESDSDDSDSDDEEAPMPTAGPDGSANFQVRVGKTGTINLKSTVLAEAELNDKEESFFDDAEFGAAIEAASAISAGAVAAPVPNDRASAKSNARATTGAPGDLASDPDDHTSLSITVVRPVHRAGVEMFNVYGVHANGGLLSKFGFAEWAKPGSDPSDRSVVNVDLVAVLRHFKNTLPEASFARRAAIFKRHREHFASMSYYELRGPGLVDVELIRTIALFSLPEDHPLVAPPAPPRRQMFTHRKPKVKLSERGQRMAEERRKRAEAELELNRVVDLISSMTYERLAGLDLPKEGHTHSASCSHGAGHQAKAPADTEEADASSDLEEEPTDMAEADEDEDEEAVISMDPIPLAHVPFWHREVLVALLTARLAQYGEPSAAAVRERLVQPYEQPDPTDLDAFSVEHSSVWLHAKPVAGVSAAEFFAGALVYDEMHLLEVMIASLSALPAVDTDSD